MHLSAAVLLLAAGTQAHYHFSRLAVNGKQEAADFGALRKPVNFQSNGFVSNVNSADIRCNQMGPGTETMTVAAGGTIGMVSNPAPYHPGPMQFYMAKVPEGQSINSWTGTGSVWFKVYSKGASGFTSSNVLWPNWPTVVSFTVPKSIPSGDYLVRGEHIGLHAASSAGGAQFYIACGQVTITNGGNGTPGPLVAFPGAYKANDPGIMVNLNYPIPTSYTPPGPPVWTG